MLDIVINKTIKSLETFYKSYNIPFIAQYNSDLDMLSQYSKSLQTRSIFGSSDLSLMTQANLDLLNKDSNILLMYNYSPLRRVEHKFNNINFEAVFDPRNPSGVNEISKLEKQAPEGDEVEFMQAIRQLNPDEPRDFTVRDMVYGEIDFTCKFLCDKSSVMNELQFLHIQKLQKNREIELEFNFGGDIGKVEMPYQTHYEPIESIGHIDYNTYGNLQQLTFTFKLEGPFFSSYSSTTPILEGIDLKISIENQE